MADDTHYIFLLKYNHYDLQATYEQDTDAQGKVTKRLVDDLAVTVRKMDTDAQHWGGPEKAIFLPVTGEYDVVVLAKGGSEADALHYAIYLHRTERYKVMQTLTVHTHDELDAVIRKDPDPKRR